MSRPTVHVVHGLGRSGTTLLARMLGCMEGIVLLSEVHPLDMPCTLRSQALSWYGIEVAPTCSLLESTEEVRSWSEARGRSLVLRDWSHLDYMPAASNLWCPRLTGSDLADLLSVHYEVRRRSILRSPTAIWSSMLKFEPTARQIEAGAISQRDFDVGYSAFAQEAESTGSVTYEDLCRSPEATIEDLCSGLGVPFDRGFADKWQSYANVTGDLPNAHTTEIKRA